MRTTGNSPKTTSPRRWPPRTCSRNTGRANCGKFETTLSEDEALLTAARGGNLPGSTPNVTSAVEYRAERKRALAAAARAMKAYVEWLGEDDDTEEEEVGTASGFVDQD